MIANFVTPSYVTITLSVKELVWRCPGIYAFRFWLAKTENECNMVWTSELLINVDDFRARNH